jgi:hypothetical protein
MTQNDDPDYVIRIIRNLAAAHKAAQKSMQLSQDEAKRHYDKAKAKGPKFVIGERVWVYHPRAAQGLNYKLCHPHLGPYIVTDIYPNSVARVIRVDRLDNGKEESYNFEKLSHCLRQIPHNVIWDGKDMIYNGTEYETVDMVEPEKRTNVSYELRPKPAQVVRGE